MINLYKEFFYIPKNGKICEKVMLMRVAMTVVIIVACLLAMGISAYAYFSHSVTSTNNMIKAANFEVVLQIKTPDEYGSDVEVINNSYKSYVTDLKANTKYFVTLTPTERSTANTGFMIVTATTADGNVLKYHTQQLGKDGEGNTKAISFTFVPEADVKVTFLAHWGTSSHYSNEDVIDEQYIKNEGVVNLSLSGVISDDENDQNVTKPTEPEETTSSDDVVYVVKSGDNLSNIAELYNTTVARLAAYNKIANPRNIRPGQVINIPPDEWVMPESETTQATTPSETTTPVTEETKPAETVEPEKETTEVADETTHVTEPVTTPEEISPETTGPVEIAPEEETPPVAED